MKAINVNSQTTTQNIYLNKNHIVAISLFTLIMSLIFAVVFLVVAQKNNWITNANIPTLGYFPIFFCLIFAIFSVYIFQKKNKIVMVKFDNQTISFKNFNVQKRLSFFDYIFYDEWHTIDTKEIKEVKLSNKNYPNKGILLNTKDKEELFIPFLFWNKTEKKVVLSQIQAFISNNIQIENENNN